METFLDSMFWRQTEYEETCNSNVRVNMLYCSCTVSWIDEFWNFLHQVTLDLNNFFTQANKINMKWEKTSKFVQKLQHYTGISVATEPVSMLSDTVDLLSILWSYQKLSWLPKQHVNLLHVYILICFPQKIYAVFFVRGCYQIRQVVTPSWLYENIVKIWCDLVEKKPKFVTPWASYEDLSFNSETGHDQNLLRLLRNATQFVPKQTVKQWKLCQKSFNMCKCSDHDQSQN